MANPFTLSNIELMMLLIIITILLFFSSCEGTRCYSPPSIPVCKTSTVVFKCAKMENSDLIRAVLPYYNIKSLDCNGMTPLHYAVIEGRHEIVEAILEIDVGRQSVCIKDIWGMNTFHWGAGIFIFIWPDEI